MAINQEIARSPQIAFVLFVVLFVGGFINLVGFAAPNWAAFGTRNTGIWQACVQGLCASIPSSLLPSWWVAVRAMMTLGFLSALAAGAVLLMFIVTAQFKKTLPALLILLACIGAALFTTIGIAIYAGESGSSSFYAWAFYLCCVSIPFFIASAVLAGVVLSRVRLLN